MKTSPQVLSNRLGGITLAAYLADPPEGVTTGLTETTIP